jgi:hypothetical protein
MSYGPRGRDWLALLFVVFAAGAGIGIGCQHGCRYVRDHLNVEWSE